MAEVSVSEARNNLSRLIKQPQDGQEIVITSHGRPVARLVPVRPVMSGAELAALPADLGGLHCSDLTAGAMLAAADL
jgi:prevent-host-death family protein